MPKSPYSSHYETWIREAVKNLPVREEISSFLFTVWVEVLAFSARQYGPHHVKTLSLEKTVTDLIWAAGARKTRRSRARTIKDTPLLMEKIREGLSLLGLPLDQQTAHVDAISIPIVDTFLSIDTRVSPVRLAKQNRARPADNTSHVADDEQTNLPGWVPALEVVEDKTDFTWSLFDDVSR
jgi:hypothetical protein